MNTRPTSETDAFAIKFKTTCGEKYWVPVDIARRLESERDEWKAKFIQQNKDLGCEQMDPNGTIWDYAKKVQSEILTVTKERAEARGQRDMMVDRLGKTQERMIDAERERDEARGQRDRLAEVIEAASVLIAAKGRHNTMLAYNGLQDALQSLNQPEQ